MLAELEKGTPYVVRFRAPDDAAGQRARFVDEIRGEEWISSVPLHAHIAPLMKQISGGKRKLSKRKDPEASVDFYTSAGYPAEAVLYYLRGLANGRLAQLRLTEALTEPIRLSECGVAGPLVNLVKLEDISADHVATLTGKQILDTLRPWAAVHDPELVGVLDTHRDLALRALAWP